MVTIKNSQANVEYNKFGTPVLLEKFISRNKDLVLNVSSGLQTANGTTKIATRGYSDWTAIVYKNFKVQISIMKHKIEDQYLVKYTPVKNYSKKLGSLEEVVEYLQNELNKFKANA